MAPISRVSLTDPEVTPKLFTHEVPLVNIPGWSNVTKQDLGDYSALNQDEKNDLLIGAAYKGNLVRMKQLLVAGAADTDHYLFRWAATNNEVGVFKLFLKREPDVHADDNWVLRNAAKYGHLEVVKLLLEAGANVHAKDDEALRNAAKYGNTEVVKLLLEAGANVHAVNDEALRTAASNGHAEIVKLLLTPEINIHSLNEAFSVAAKNGRVEVVKLLLEHGAV
jgi:ankyrin repeat protein